MAKPVRFDGPPKSVEEQLDRLHYLFAVGLRRRRQQLAAEAQEKSAKSA